MLASKIALNYKKRVVNDSFYYCCCVGLIFQDLIQICSFFCSYSLEFVPCNHKNGSLI